MNSYLIIKILKKLTNSNCSKIIQNYGLIILIQHIKKEIILIRINPLTDNLKSDNR
jgi:hypothetical protein